MAFCPKCRAEYREGFARCADCDLDLVDRRPDPPPEKPWTILFAGDCARADVIRGSLEAAGIETIAPDETGVPLLSLYAPSSFRQIRLFVRESDLAQAREIMEGLHRLDSDKAGPASDAPEKP